MITEEKYKLIKLFPMSSNNIGSIRKLYEWEGKYGIDASKWPEFFEKVKEPLMVTFDGKEMFDENDIVYGMHRVLVNVHVYDAISMNNLKFFSTSELAKKYHEETKPRFSEKQILEASVKAWTSISGYIDLDKFKKELGI